MIARGSQNRKSSTCRRRVRCFNRIVKLGFLPSSMDARLFFLRVAVGLSLFMKHGYGKIVNFSQMALVFSDPLHIGHTPSLIVAMLSDSICSLLIVFGLASRWAAAWCFCTIFCRLGVLSITFYVFWPSGG